MILLLGCNEPTRPDEPVFPAVYTPETNLEDYEEIRFETETWTPVEDIVETLLYAEKSLLHRQGAPVESLEHWTAMRDHPPLGAGKQLDFAGDVMWVGENWDSFLAPVAPLLDGDLRIANLETPVDPSQPTARDELDLYAFNAPPEILDGLPFDLLQLNNNHTLDMGNSGITATVAQVESKGFAHTGIDAHALIDGVAFLSYTWGLNVQDQAPEPELYVVPFGHLEPQLDLSGIQAAIADARASADSVVVLLHWGFEYEYYPDPYFMVLARQIVAMGADVIVGHGPHVAQPVELCAVNGEAAPGIGRCVVEDGTGVPRTAAIFYSLGNMGTAMETLPCQVGVIASVTLNPDVTGVGWQAVVSLAGPVRVEPITDHLDDPEIASEYSRLQTHLGASWSR